MGSVLDAMKTSPIVGVHDIYEGTQLKLSLLLKGNQTVIFKPRRPWVPTSSNSEIYSGPDRHEGEIAGFLLSFLLDFHFVPPAVERKVSILKDILPHASKALSRTIFLKERSSCLYGLCYYCKKSNPVCGDKGDRLDGSAILWLPSQLTVRHFLHPWARTYNKEKSAPWELDPDFCHKFEPSFFSNDERIELLLNLIDMSIFDFLIQNGDRHHYIAAAALERSNHTFNQPSSASENSSPLKIGRISRKPVKISLKDVSRPSHTKYITSSKTSTSFTSRTKYSTPEKFKPSLANSQLGADGNKTQSKFPVFHEYLTAPFLIALDNGKSLKNAFVDHMDILAPLFQCCRLRRDTYDRLLHLKGGGLSRVLKQLLKDIGSPFLLSHDHLEAMDRRLLYVLAAVQSCLDSTGGHLWL